MEIMIFGAGYVGCVTAAGLASTGNHVSLVDSQSERIKNLELGILPIFEPGLLELMQSSTKTGHLRFIETETEDFWNRLETSEVYFLAVGTPEDRTGRTRLDAIESVVDLISKQPGRLDSKVVVVKSTVPVGTGDRIEDRFRKASQYPVVVSNPEFLKEGNAIQDFLKPERVIIGTDDDRTREIMGFLYKPFMLKQDRLVFMSRRSAELSKYACNAFLATKISFINEMARLSEAMQADIREVRQGMITDSRIGDEFLFPGIGYGGSCFPKDVHSLIVQAKDQGIEMKIPEAADFVNRSQRLWALNKLLGIFGENFRDKVFAIWGLSFKPNTDDLREAPSVYLMEQLIERGAKIRAYDPVARTRAQEIFADHLESDRLNLTEDPYEAAEGADALLILTEWRSFRSPHFRILKETMREKLILDGRNILDSKIAENYGFDYVSVGMPHDKDLLSNTKVKMIRKRSDRPVAKRSRVSVGTGSVA